MNTAEDFKQLFDSIADVVHTAGGTDQVVFVPVARQLLPQLIEGVEPKRIWAQHHGTPGVYELVLEAGDREVDLGPRPAS